MLTLTRRAYASTLGGLALVVAFALALPAQADVQVAFDTTGFFSSTHTDLLPIGGGVLEFKDESLTTVTTPSIISLGVFDTHAIDGGGPVPAGETFNLTIEQVLPASGKQLVVGTVAGSVFATQSLVFVKFAPDSFNIDGIHYDILQQANGFPIEPPSIDAGITPLQAFAAPIPEPGYVGLLAIGLGFIGAGVRRRRK